jgi:hypothetical protein
VIKLNLKRLALKTQENGERYMAEPQDYSKYPQENYNEFTTPDVTAWKLARAAIEHENNLVNQRITWLLTSQAYLLTAFAVLFVAWGKPKEIGENIHSLIPRFMFGIGFLAIYVCVVIQNSVYRAFRALYTLTKHYDKLVEENKFYYISKDQNNKDIKLTRTPPLHLWEPPFLVIINQHFLPLGALIIWIALLALFAYHLFQNKYQTVVDFYSRVMDSQYLGNMFFLS